MANIKNFGLVGVGADLQFGKAGTRLINNAGTFNFKAAGGTVDAALTAAGITSSGSLSLSGSDGTVSINGDTTLSRQQAGVFQFNGTNSVIIPSGTSAERAGTAAAGMLRFNTENTVMEYFDGSIWDTVGNSGSITTLQTEVDHIETSLGAAINSSGVYVPSGFTGAVIGTTSTFTDAIQNVADFASSHSTLEGVFGATAAGNIIYADTSSSWAQAAPGATSGVQAYSAKLASLAANATNGIISQDSSGTVVARSLVAPTRGFTISNADGVSGNPTFTLANNLAAIESLGSSTGYVVFTADGVATTRTIGGVSGQITITDGDGVLTNTDIGLATVSQASSGDFVKVTLDGYGRVTGNKAVLTSDIRALVDSTYVNVTGDSMSGTLTMTSGATVTGLPNPVNASDAANKAYVDAAVAGLNVHAAVETATTAPLTATYDNGTAGVGATLTATTNVVLPTIGGYAGLAVAGRVLVKNQADSKQNGIYVVTSLGVAGTSPWVLTRASDYDNSIAGEVAAGDFMFVQEGTNASTGWVETTVGTGVNDAIIIGTDNITFTQYSGAGTYSAGTGLSLTGTTFSVNLGAGIAELPTSDVGIDLFSPSAGALILTDDGTTRATDASAQLHLLLKSAGGLTQDVNGLYIPATGVTNAMLANSAVSLNADSGTGTLSLGGTLLIEGTSAQGISTSVTGSTFAITAADATTLAKGVASFDSASFSVTSGAVSLSTVDVPHGGTGATSFTANQVLYGNGTSALQSDAALTFVPSGANGTLTVGGANGASIATSGTDSTISALATNANLVLMPNGTGSVIVGPSGAGAIASEAGKALTVTGATVLTLASVTGNTTMALPVGSYVDTSGQTAAQYATAIASVDTALTNKKYVDNAIATGAANGAVKAFQVVVPLNANATVAIGSAIPSGATVLRVKVNVTVADSAATLEVGFAGNVAAFMTSVESDPQATGMYVAETLFTVGSTTQVNATVAATGATSGSTCVVIFEYQLAQ